MQSTKSITHNYPVMYFLIESKLLMTEENLLSRLTHVTNFESSGMMIVPRQHGQKLISRYKKFKQLLLSLQFTRSILIYFNILAKFKHNINLYYTSVCLFRLFVNIKIVQPRPKHVILSNKVKILQIPFCCVHQINYVL